MESASVPDADVLVKIRDAHALMSQAIALLDEAGAPGEADAHLDLAICCIATEITRLAAAENPASSAADPPSQLWGGSSG